MSIVLPFTLQEDTDADATQVMANFNALRTALEGIGAASTASDIYQAGVLASSDFVVGGSVFTLNASTGALTFNISNGAAWVPGPAGALVRVFTPAAEYTLTPPSLPASGGFRKIGIEITASGDTTIVSMVSGSEQASEALAIANPPAVTAGKVRIFDYVLQNSSGTYSTHAGRDRRPWARGALTILSRTSGAITLTTSAGAALDSTGLALRVECSGVPVRLLVKGIWSSEKAEGSVNFSFKDNGTLVSSASEALYRANAQQAAESAGFAYSYEFVPSAGSHLFIPTGNGFGGLKQVQSNAKEPLIFTVEELRPNANNGTA